MLKLMTSLDIIRGSTDTRVPVTKYSFSRGLCQPSIVAVRSKAWSGFARPNAGIVGSKPTPSTEVRVYDYEYSVCR
jgi:hypothetical protein